MMKTNRKTSMMAVGAMLALAGAGVAGVAGAGCPGDARAAQGR